MGMDFWVECPGPNVLTKEKLTSESRKRGWQSLFVIDDAVFGQQKPFIASQTGPVEKDTCLLGWLPVWPSARRIEAVLQSEDPAALFALLEKDEINVMSFSWSENERGHEYNFGGRSVNFISNWDWFTVLMKSLATVGNGKIVDAQMEGDENEEMWSSLEE